ncbi:MAG: sigma-70 family polymerase sigma factor, partial [Solirubrobacteraceae bacterium]|nr:sigma-70 family polymerase sigma factor [Solirubrobacteraceae bacterium]
MGALFQRKRGRRQVRRLSPVLRLIDGEATDEELVRRLRAGDEAAFAAIVGRYGRRLEAHARRTLSGRGHDAEDVVQEAFVRAHRAL